MNLPFRLALTFSVRHPVFVLLVACGLSVWGWWLFASITFEPIPDYEARKFTISIQAANKTAAEMQPYVSQIELAVRTNAGSQIERTAAFELDGQGTIFVFARSAVDAKSFASWLLTRALSVELPAGFRPPEVLGPESPLSPVLEFRLNGPGYTVAERARVLKRVVAPRLKRMRGVSDVRLYGGEKAYLLTVDPNELGMIYGLSPDDVGTAVKGYDRSADISLDEAGITASTRSRLAGNRDELLDALKHLPIASTAGRPLSLGRIGIAVDEGLVPRQHFAVDRNGDAVIGQLLRDPRSSSQEVKLEMQQAILELSPSLPEGMTVEILYDVTELARREWRTVVRNQILGFLAVIAALYFLTRSFGESLGAALAVPVSSALALLLLQKLGVSLSLVTLGSVDFGFVADPSIVNISAVLAYRRLRGGVGTPDNIVEAVSQTRGAAVLAECALIVGLVSLWFLPGRLGEIFRPLAISLQVLLLVAIVFSVTVVPALLVLFPGMGRKSGDRPSFSDSLARDIEPLQRALLRCPRWVVTAAHAGLLIVSVLVLLGRPWQYLPAFDEGDFILSMEYAAQKSPDQLKAESLDLLRALTAKNAEGQAIIPEIREVYGMHGSSGDDPMTVNFGDLRLLLKPRREWRRGVTREMLERYVLNIAAEAAPAAVCWISQPIDYRVSENAGDINSPLAFIVQSESAGEEEFTSTVDRLVERFRTIEGVDGSRLFVPNRGRRKHITFEPRADRLARFRVEPKQLFDYDSWRSGVVLGSANDHGAPVPIIGRFLPEYKAPERLLSARLLTVRSAGSESAVTAPTTATVVPLPQPQPLRQPVPFAELVTAKEQEARVRLLQLNGVRAEVISITPLPFQPVQVVHSRIERALKDEQLLPAGMTHRWGGRYVMLQELWGFGPALLASLAGMAVLLFFATGAQPALFRTLCQSTVAAFSISVIALQTADLPISASALVAVILSTGMSTFLGILWIREAESSAALQPELPLEELAVEASRRRLKPILGTTITSVVATVGTLMLGGEGSEIVQPQAVAITGAVPLMAAYVLLVLPRLYIGAKSTMS
jgi:cobalt-zinc-cadmium resistance protein CzcA